MNSPFVQEVSEGFARHIVSLSGDDQAKLRWAFETTHGQTPDDGVVGDAIAFVSAYREKIAGDTAVDKDIAAWSAVARVLLTSNGFLYVD